MAGSDLIVRVGADLKEFADAGKGFDGVLGGIGKSVEGLGDRLSGAFGGVGSAIGSAAKTVAVAGAAIGVAGIGIGAAAYKIGSTFDDAYDTIRVATGATGQALEDLKDDFKAVASSVPADFDAVSAVVSDLNKRTGATGKSLQGLSERIIQMSRLTKTDATQNVADATRVFGDWSIATEDQGAALDKLFRASQATGIGISGLQQAVVQFGAPLRAMGFSFDESISLLGKWEKEGVNSELVLGSMRIAMGHFAAENIPMRKGLDDTIATIQKLGPGAKATSLAMEIFGARAGPDMAAAILEGRFALGDLLKTVSDGSDTILNAAGDTADFAEKWKITLNKATIALEPFASAVFSAAGSLLDALTPAIAGIVAAVADLAKTGDLGVVADGLRDAFGIDITPLVNLQRWLGKVLPGAIATARDALVGYSQRMTTFWGSLAEGETLATTVNRAFGDLIPASLNATLDAVDNAFAALKLTFEGLIDVFVGNVEWSDALEAGLTKIFGPGGTTEAAITTIFAFQEAWQNLARIAGDVATAYGEGGAATAFDQLTASMQRAGAAQTAGALTTALTESRTALGNLQAGLSAIGDALSMLVGQFNSSGASALNWGKILDTVFGGVLRAVIAPIAGFNALAVAAKYLVDTEVETGTLVVASVARMADFLVSSLANIVAATSAAWTAVATSVTVAWQNITGAVQGATAAVLGAISGAWNAVMNVTDSNGVTLRSAISSNWNAIVAWTQLAWQTVRDTVASWLGSAESVVRSATDSVASTVSTKWDEITGATSRAWESVSTTISGILTGAGGVVATVSSAFGSIVSSVTSKLTGDGGVVSVVSSAWGSVKTAIATALDASSGAQAIVSSALDAIVNLLTGSGVANAASTFGGQIVSGITGALSSLGQGLRDAIGAAIRSIDVTIGMFHITATGVTVSWPTIKPPTISSSSLSLALDVSGFDAGSVSLPRGASSLGSSTSLGRGALIDYDKLAAAFRKGSRDINLSVTNVGGERENGLGLLRDVRRVEALYA